MKIFIASNAIILTIVAWVIVDNLLNGQPTPWRQAIPAYAAGAIMAMISIAFR